VLIFEIVKFVYFNTASIPKSEAAVQYPVLRHQNQIKEPKKPLLFNKSHLIITKTNRYATFKLEKE
jgi:hypothetical protein